MPAAATPFSRAFRPAFIVRPTLLHWVVLADAITIYTIVRILW